MIGYARVSTLDQDPQLQVNALEAAGCSRVFVEQASGTHTAGRYSIGSLTTCAKATRWSSGGSTVWADRSST
ncbi:MAG TPA: recombinase family protein [Solirubrobacterales bacterium]|nr:recombinase family protein [Solirubrobacterales bacterium]